MERIPLALRSTFGFSQNLVNGVQSLGESQTRTFYFASANCGVVYNYSKRNQILLQGHSNQISCVAVDSSKRWIVSGDSGEDSLIILWNAETGSPEQTIFNAHPHGVASVDLSSDCRFISALSAFSNTDDQIPQQILVWNAASNDNIPISRGLVPLSASQTFLRFNPDNAHEIITNGPSQVFFWTWETEFSCRTPHFLRQDFRQAFGQLTVSAFLPGTTQAITGTSDGTVILWDGSGVRAHHEPNIERVAVKIIRLCGHSIHQLKTVGSYLVVAGEDGAVRLYDYLFRLEAWFEDINAGPITSVSFTRDATQILNKNISLSCRAKSAHASRGQAPNHSSFDIFVGTRSATIVALELSCFQSADSTDRCGTVLIQGTADCVSSLATHPKLPLVLIACESGVLYLWDYQTREFRAIRPLDTTKTQPCRVIFNEAGNVAAVGFTTGLVKILDALTLSEVGASFKIAKEKIVALAFSPGGQWLAAADTGHNVALWKNSQPDKSGQSWIYIGRHHSHTKAITGLTFGSRDGKSVALVSIGEDRILQEYDLTRSSVAQGLCLLDLPLVLEESAVPTACLWHPAQSEDFEHRIITCNSLYKLRQWNATSKECRRTSLGPTYGGPVTQLVTLAQDTSHITKFLAYSTCTNLVGLIKMPLDGNPNETAGILAHPKKVSCLAYSADGMHIFTCGDGDEVMNIWDVHTGAIGNIDTEGRGDCEPYLSLLDGGAGNFYESLHDYFYYAQLRTLGETATRPRDLSARVPLQEIPNLMRALGYYPSELEIVRMISEVKYANFCCSGLLQCDITLNQFIRLYYNHKPPESSAMDRELLRWNFGEVCRRQVPHTHNGRMQWHRFQDMLGRCGERLSNTEMRSCMLSTVGKIPLEVCALHLEREIFDAEEK